MSVDESTVINIAKLAHLEISPQEIPKYAKDLSKILEVVQTMDQIDTQGIEPMSHSLLQDSELRADAVTEVNNRDGLQQSAPAIAAGLYLVPQVIE